MLQFGASSQVRHVRSVYRCRCRERVGLPPRRDQRGAMNVDLDGDAFRVRYGGRRLGDRLSSVDAVSCAFMFLTAMRTTDKARDDLAMVSLASHPNPQTARNNSRAHPLSSDRVSDVRTAAVDQRKSNCSTRFRFPLRTAEDKRRNPNAIRLNVAQVVDCVPRIAIRSSLCEITYKTR